MSCLFCRIIAGEIPAAKVYEDDRMIAFKDINPQAPMHVLVVPRKHVATLNDLTTAEDATGWRDGPNRGGDCEGKRLRRTRLRTVFNCNAQAGQTVFHIHLHVLGGRRWAGPRAKST